METHKVYTSIVVLVCLFSSVWTFEIELYSEKDRRGQSIKIDVSDDDCSELPLAWHSGVVSIDTLGNCVQLYDEPKCSGSLSVIQPFHIIHQMDLTLINYAFRLRTVSPCGPKLKSGRYVIQNAADASVMAALNKHGNFAKVYTANTTKSAAVPKSQQWEVLEKANNEYTLKPRENSDNYPVSFDEESLKKGVIKRKPWRIMSVGRGRYIIKDPATQRCLYLTEDHKVEEHSCRIWSTNQEWVFRAILGDPPNDKPKAQVGTGANFNILSKVATSRPPTRPPPQYYPIHYNATKLAQIQKLSTATPYRIKKKIKRGPRPQTKYVEEPSIDLKPPGLRPAIPKNVANNNNFLLYKPATGVAQDSYLPEFIPTDDVDLLPTKEMIKSTKQYQQYVQVVKQYLAEQHLKSIQNANANGKGKKKKKGSDEDDDDDGGEEEDDTTKEQTSDEKAEDDENNSDESVSEGTAEQHVTEKPKKGKHTTPSSADRPASDLETPNSDQPGFMSQVFTKFKSNFAAMVPTVGLPSIPSLSLPSLPSVPVPKISLSFTKGDDKKSREKHITHGSGNSESGGFQFSYATGPGHQGKNGENQRTEQQRPKFTLPLRPSRFFQRTTSTTTKKPLTVGSWGIFG